MKNLKNFESWEKQQLITFKKDNQIVYLIVEFNQFYGYLITHFQIGDVENSTTVKIDKKYCGTKQDYLTCQEQNSLIGERKFENDSVTWEFLWKPLGLENKGEKRNLSQPVYTSLSEFKEAAEKQGWKKVNNWE